MNSRSPAIRCDLDYAYRYNGTRGYIQAVALGTDATQAKILAYTAECIRARAANSVFTAVTEVEPSPESPRQEFIARLFADQRIDLVPLNRIERFAEDLRPSIVDLLRRVLRTPSELGGRQNAALCDRMSGSSIQELELT